MDEFKRRGYFDQVRKQLLQQFQEGHQGALLSELDDRLEEYVEKEADRLAFRDTRLRHADLMRHADRLPIVDSLGERLRDPQGVALLAKDGPIAQLVSTHVSALVAARVGTDTPGATTPGADTPQVGTPSNTGTPRPM